MVVLPIIYPCVPVSYWMDKLSNEMNCTAYNLPMCPCFLLNGQIEQWNELCKYACNYLDCCTAYNLPMCPCFLLDGQIEQWNELCKYACNYFHNFLSKIYGWALFSPWYFKAKSLQIQLLPQFIKALEYVPVWFWLSFLAPKSTMAFCNWEYGL